MLTFASEVPTNSRPARHFTRESEGANAAVEREVYESSNPKILAGHV